MAARTSSTITSGTPSPRGRWQTSAAAPRSIAWGAKSWPSARKPGTQKKSEPGSTASVEYASPVTSTSGAPFPINSRRVIGPPSLIGGYAQIRERELHDLLERGRGHRASVDVAARLVHHYRHQQARLAGGRVADE